MARSRLPRHLRLMAAVILAGLASGCVNLAPTYTRPALPAPAALPQGGAYGRAEPVHTAAPDLAWRDFFTDPKLRQVIALALDNNRDLRVAVLNVAEARARYRVQRAALLPHVDAQFAPTYEHEPTALLGATTGATGAGTGAAAVKAPESIFIRYYTATLGVSDYEVDLWGRVRNLNRQALEAYLATDEARRATQISLISQVATDYVTYAADLERLEVSGRTVKADAETVRVTRARFAAGIASELDVRQAQIAEQQAAANVATYTATLAQDVDALTLLVGAPTPASLLPGPLSDNFATLPDLPAGLSSEVLLRRPDVQEAEHGLRGYNANIGAARAAFFPALQLTSDGGSASLSLSNLFGRGTGLWMINPTVTLPIFDAGINAANLRLAKNERDVALAQYEKAIQTAFREVADALAQHGMIGDELAAQNQEVFASSRSLGLSTARYQRGADTYLNTLTSQVSLYNAQLSQVSTRLTRATNLITLYQVLGGGVR